MIEPVVPEYRIGIGTDVHLLVPDRRLMLGGVQIPFHMGLVGHSDGDVVLHAVIDAILGAAAMGDIGTFFPDTDPQYKDADSKGLLLDVRDKVAARNWHVVNVDLVIQLEQPRLEPFKGQIRRCIADLLDMDFGSVNVKAKTAEGLGEIGQGKAIAATAVALLRQKARRP